LNEGIIMKNAIRIIAMGVATLAQFSTASAEAPVFDWEKPGYQASAVSEKSRAEVMAELKEARASGQLSVSENYYPAFQQVVGTGEGKTRAQVRAEAVEARRLGLVSQGDTHMPTATPEQLAAIERAGMRAAQPPVITAAQ
jgi:Domain of unknown function (DUF4148)